MNHSAANQSRRTRSGAQGERAVEAALALSERAGLGYLRKRPTETRMRMLRLIENMTLGRNAVG